MTADRAGIRNCQLSAPGEIICNLRNDHIGFIYLDRIADTKLQLVYNADIVYAGTTDGGSFQLYRLKDGNRVDQAGTGGTPFNLKKGCVCCFVCPFKCHSVSRKFGGHA